MNLCANGYQAMRGDIAVYSEPGWGTSFKIYLAAVTEEGAGQGDDRSGAGAARA